MGIALLAVALLAVLAIALPAGSAAEQASQPGAPAAGGLDVSGNTNDSSGHTCARLATGDLRCWGFAGQDLDPSTLGDGRLGYGNDATIGDDETPGAVGPVDLGPDRRADAVSAGAFHTCALLDDKTVRCWGFGINGRLGYGNTFTVGDDETPGTVGPVKIGGPATAITAGNGHTCALLADDSVRCWGFGDAGQLGYASRDNVGDDEEPQAKGPVDVGAPVEAISAGSFHTCALLVDGAVRCWGAGDQGQLGYGNTTGNNRTDVVGDDETPASVGPVDLGGPAEAISTGEIHTCALLVSGAVRCWGSGANGRLGYGNTEPVGDNEVPAAVDPVDLGQPAQAISAGDKHTCALLEDGSVRCWGLGEDGRLGYGNIATIGDDERPVSAGPVDLGGSAHAISAGGRHTCALLADGSFRCWGSAANGRLGYCNTNDIGDDEAPRAAGPVNVLGSSDCPVPARPAPSGGGGSTSPTTGSPAPRADDSLAERYRRALAAQAARKRALRRCLRRVARRASSRRRAARRRCLRRHGRTPGRVAGLTARASSRTKVVLGFRAAGTHRSRLPAARSYVVKQSTRPIRGRRGFRRAQTLCDGNCRFSVRLVGKQLALTITDLRPRTTYYYAVAARDNVSGRTGPRSRTLEVRTRG